MITLRFYSIPGGHLELGERFVDAAIREVKEETDLDIIDPEVIAVTNNLRTFAVEGTHTISVVLRACSWQGELKNMEPHKCSDWLWADPYELPQPHFDASEIAVECYVTGAISIS